MSEWKGLQCRISLFPPPTITKPSPFDMFRSIWLTDPENFKSQANPLVPTVANGNVRGLSISCITQPGRIDFNITPAEGLNQDVSISLIDDTSRLHAELVKIIEAISQNKVALPVFRVAIVGQFVKILETIADANKIVTDVMPTDYRVRLNLEKDFIFQVNNPYDSRSIANVKMNSIRKWSVERFQIIMIQMQSGGPVPIADKHLTSEYLGASVTFENNNVPVPQQQLSTEEQARLLREGLEDISQAQACMGLNLRGF
jgi:hypothetical protein